MFFFHIKKVFPFYQIPLDISVRPGNIHLLIKPSIEWFNNDKIKGNNSSILAPLTAALWLLSCT